MNTTPAASRAVSPAEPYPVPALVRPPRPGPDRLVAEFFAELERRGISHVILHDHEHLPSRPEGDIDYAVSHRDLPRVRPVLESVAHRLGWVVAQTVRHGLFAYYSVAFNADDPSAHVALDACSHYAAARCLLVRDAVLLDGRRRQAQGFFVPASASEFAYLLAKALTRGPSLDLPLARLRHLHALDPQSVQQRFVELLGDTGRGVEDWLGEPAAAWTPLRDVLRSRHRYGPLRLAGEALRIAGRLLRPTGLHLAVLGPDGAGKSTLINNLGTALALCFGPPRVLKFRPDVFGRIEPGVDPRPHEREPRGRFVSWLKIAYYYADWWLGWAFVLRPALARNGLVVFDRDFNDMVVDPRRYLVQGVGGLVRLLRRLLPSAAATFVLDADPHAVHARKPELPVEELERQRAAYRKLAAGGRRYRLVAADRPPAEVVRSVAGDVVALLAARERRRHRGGVPAGKRLFDLAAALLLLVLVAPVLAVLAMLVRLKMGAPILFRQRRPGLHGRPFTMYKFRTMTDARGADGRELPDAQRMTPFGKFLRSTSLDELPEIFNVLRGDMSLVGPRPLLVEYLARYSAEQMRRHDVLPGITGWAQVNGRNAASWPQKFALDLWYVDHRSLWLDLKILALTVRTVLRREGISQPGRATVDRFFGNGATAAPLPQPGESP